MSMKKVKKDLFEQFARVGKALSNGNRLELLELLAQGERNVHALAKLSGLTIVNTSQHLRQLHQTGLVSTRKEGLFVYYRLADEAVVDLMGLMQTIAENNLAEVDRLIRTFLMAKDNLEPVSASDLMERVREDMVMVLDVRPSEEFAVGHLPGAINIPMGELEKKLSELPTDQEIVAYCRGPYCMLSFEAVSKLREKGYQVRRLENGYPEWKREGLPIEVSELA